jgi:7,8-dihydropterin-6-yl-methyl-4-(beta-D-ribofuranosyl)aminobenzene 5'-phosphate synthase
MQKFAIVSLMRIRIIYDNCKERSDLEMGWGFSALVETPSHTILFDTGNDENAFYSNLEKMDINYRHITDVVFSHKHDDHTAGAAHILRKLGKECRVYLPKGFPQKKIDFPSVSVSDFQEIGKNIFSMVLKGGFFLYEQFLILQTAKGLVIITGCAHPGVISIVEAVQKKLKSPIHCVLGGFHLFRKNPQSIENIVQKFKILQVEKVGPCHCSGKQTIDTFQEIYGKDFIRIGAGSVIEFSNR